jgi:hypothetical protein
MALQIVCVIYPPVSRRILFAAPWACGEKKLLKSRRCSMLMFFNQGLFSYRATNLFPGMFRYLCCSVKDLLSQNP